MKFTISELSPQYIVNEKNERVSVILPIETLQGLLDELNKHNYLTQEEFDKFQRQLDSDKPNPKLERLFRTAAALQFDIEDRG